jgi:hypothetical protein
MTEKEGKYLTFLLQGEEYGIGVSKIKSIIGMMPIRSVPQAPDFVRGVINLRDRAIPVLDLRLRFGMQEIEYSDRTCIIIVEVEHPEGSVNIGLVVDADGKSGYILRMAKRKDSETTLLSIERMLHDQLEPLESPPLSTGMHT